MDPQVQNEVLRKVRTRVLESVKGSWTEISLTYDALATLATYRITVTRPDGTKERTALPNDVSEMMFQLRDRMHESGNGTWFSARYTLTPPNGFRIDFDYYNPPSFPFEPDPKTYYEDLAQYPRTVDNAPEWLNDKVRTALAAMKH